MKLIKPTQHFKNELQVVSQPFDFDNPPFDPAEFAIALGNKMIKENGVGLAAIQVGYPYRIFAVRSDPVYVCINPKIVDLSGKEHLAEEGCLSFPGMLVKVKRFEEVRLRFQHVDGKYITRKFAGLAARVVQHEFDHMDGILHYNRASRYHRDAALKKWERAMKAHARAQKLNKEETARKETVSEPV
jgi:peptide deformylase